MNFFGWLKRIFTKKKPQPLLGIAFGSGGAKGMAHIGALKAFEEEGLEFSVVTGTSIGSIVGALYAKGFSASDMISIIENLNVKEFSGGTLRPYMDMSGIARFLGGYLEGEISSLPKPYASWATDTSNNEGVLLSSGNIAKCCCASSAIPPFFRPVDIDGKMLADGAFTNAIPTDVNRKLGADVVIGIDLSAFAVPEEEKGTFAKLLGRAMSALTPVSYLKDSKTRGYENADVMLRPDLRNFKATDVSRVDMHEMYERGYEEAKACMPEIKEVLEKAGYRFTKENAKDKRRKKRVNAQRV